MMRVLLIFFFLGIFQSAFGQEDFDSLYRNTNPAGDNIQAEEKKRLHQAFLSSSQSQHDTLKLVLGNLYLAVDYQKEADYSSSMIHLIEAGNFATALRDTLALGRVNHKKAAVYYFLDNYPEAIKYFQTALSQSEIARDSQYIAITLEQLGSTYAYLKDYNKSNEYYQKAIPLVEKFASPNSLATTLINYGSLLDEQDSVDKAIRVYKKAIRISEQIPNEYKTVPAKQNLALVYAKHDSLDKALVLYHECREANEKNAWLDFLIYAYKGLGLIHEKLGNTDSALYYYQKFYELKDSVVGTKIQSQVNQLENENILYEKNIAILRQKEATFLQKEYTKNILIGAFLLLTSSILSLWFLYQKSQRTKNRLKENRQSLHQLTKLLESKNSEIRGLKIQSISQKSDSETDDGAFLKNINMYDLSILTDADWHTFKTLFDKSYPNFLIKVRRNFPNISEAEERMFVFIKLQLSNKESANIVGVQPETIKKTRSRLRKRIGLKRTENLNEFILNFG